MKLQLKFNFVVVEIFFFVIEIQLSSFTLLSSLDNNKNKYLPIEEHIYIYHVLSNNDSF